MAITVKWDLHGSDYTFGQETNRDSRIVRRGLAEDIPTDTTWAIETYNAALSALEAEWTNPMPSIVLRTIRMSRFGAESALLTATFARTSLNVPTDPFAAASIRGLIREVMSWRSYLDADDEGPVFDGWLPGGRLLNDNNLPYEVDVPPQKQKNPIYNITLPVVAFTDLPVDVPVAKVVVRTVLPFNPFGQVINKLKKTNSDPVTFAGTVVGANGMTFDDIHVVAVTGVGPVVGSIEYRVEYAFTFYASPGCVKEQLIQEGEVGNPQDPRHWTVKLIQNEFAQAEFANGFPVA